MCAEFDEEMLKTVLSFTGTVTDSAFTQVRRSTKTGGLGFRAAQNHASAAYLASLTTCAGLDHWDPSQTGTGYTEALTAVASATDLTVEQVRTIATTQADLSKAIEDKAFSKDLASASLWDRMRMISQSAPHAADWLLAIPSSDMNQVFTPREFVAVVRWWLGQHVYDEEEECPACGQLSDKGGYHALVCGSWGGRIHRHHALANECARTLVKAHHSPSREKSLDGTTRPADVYLPHWSIGKPLALDFAVTHPQQPQSFSIAGEVTPGSWATAYGTLHKSQFEAPCEKRGVQFQAMVVETFGAWDPTARQMLESFANEYAIHQDVDAKFASRILFQRLSITLMRMNARMLLVRNSSGFDEETPLFNEWEQPDITVEADVWEIHPDPVDEDGLFRF